MTLQELKRYLNKDILYCMIFLLPISYPLVIQYSQWINIVQTYYNIPDIFLLCILKSIAINIGVMILMALFIKKVIDTTYKYGSCNDISPEEFVEYKLELLKREFQEKFPDSDFNFYQKEKE